MTVMGMGNGGPARTSGLRIKSAMTDLSALWIPASAGNDGHGIALWILDQVQHDGPGLPVDSRFRGNDGHGIALWILDQVQNDDA